MRGASDWVSYSMYVCSGYYHELSTNCLQKLINTFIPVLQRTTCQLIHTSFTPYSGPPEDYMQTDFTPLFMPIWACSVCLFLFYIYLLSYPFTQSCQSPQLLQVVIFFYISKSLITIFFKFLLLGIAIYMIT